MPNLIAEFQKQYPSLQIQVKISSGDTLEDLLCRDKLDLAFVEGTVSGTELHGEPFGKNRLILIVPPEHPLLPEELVIRDVQNGTVWQKRLWQGIKSCQTTV